MVVPGIGILLQVAAVGKIGHESLCSGLVEPRLPDHLGQRQDSILKIETVQDVQCPIDGLDLVFVI